MLQQLLVGHAILDNWQPWVGHAYFKQVILLVIRWRAVLWGEASDEKPMPKPMPNRVTFGPTGPCTHSPSDAGFRFPGCRGQDKDNQDLAAPNA